MNLSLLGKKAIVCGSTDGIGKSSAMLMAKRGAEIILVSRNKDKLEMTISELSWENGQNHSFISADFNNSDELEEKTMEIAKKITEKSPYAIERAKQSVKSVSNMKLKEGLKFEREMFLECFNSDDGKEGITAFIEKRKANLLLQH